MTIASIANLESGLSVRGKLNDLIGLANAELINPTEFGAVGDGSVDDTSAVNDAIALSNSSGLGILLPAGKVFRVTANLTTFTNGMVVVGGGTIKAPNAVNCLRHFPTGWATGVTERTITSLSLSPDWQGHSGHNVTVVNMASTSGLAVGQWVKLGSSTIQVPGPNLNFWFEWAQVRAITTNANITLDRVLEGHARGLLPGVHANYKMFAFPTTVRSVVVDVGFEADESGASVYSTSLTGRSPFLLDRGSVNAFVRVRGHRWWTTVVQTHGVLARVEASWEDLPDITDVADANQALGYGVNCSSGAHAVSATVIGGNCRHGFTTTANTLTVYDAARPFELGLSFYCGTTPASRISGASAAAFDTHVQSFGARLFGEATAGVEQVDSDASSLACQDRGFNTTIAVRATSAHFRGFQLKAAETDWGSLGHCVTILDDVESRDANGGSHVLVLGTSTITAVTCLFRSPVFVGANFGAPNGIVVAAGFAGRLVLEDPIYLAFNAHLIRDESGLATIELHGGHASYGVATPPAPFLVASTAADRGDGTTSWWIVDGMYLRQVSTSQPDGLFRNDASLNMNVQLGRIITPLGDLPVRSASSTGAQVALGALFDTGDAVPFANATGSMAGAATGRNWKLTGNVTAVPVRNGWKAKFVNDSGSNKSVTPASGTCVVVESGATAGSVTVAANKAIDVMGDGTNLWIFGDVV